MLLATFRWWFQSDIGLTAIYFVIAVIAVVSVPIAYRLFGYAQEDDARWIIDSEAREYGELITRLAAVREELTALDMNEGARQGEILTEIIDDYHSVVGTRFIGKKYSPLEYLGAARRVQKQALQNLVDLVAVGHSMSSIVRTSQDTSRFESEEKVLRQTRHSGMYAEQETRVEYLLGENRKLFDALSETAVEVANIQSFSKFDRLDTLARLVGLAEMANKTGH